MVPPYWELEYRDVNGTAEFLHWPIIHVFLSGIVKTHTSKAFRNVFVKASLFLLLRQFVYHEALVTSITDMYPSFFQTGHRRKFLLLFICAASFLVGLLMVTEV